MVPALANLRVWLEGVHPLAPALALVALLFFGQYAVRKLAPGFWEGPALAPFRLFGVDPATAGAATTLAFKAWQTLPSAAGAALLAALSSNAPDPLSDVWLAVLGVCAPVVHEVMKALPFLPYRGATRALARSSSPDTLRLLPLLFAVGVSPAAAPGCTPRDTPEARGAQIAQGVKVAYVASSLALAELGKWQADWMATQSSPDAAAAARVMVKALDLGREALARARPLVATGRDEAAIRRELAAVLEQAELIVAELGRFQRVPSNEILEALGYLRGFLGAGS